MTRKFVCFGMILASLLYFNLANAGSYREVVVRLSSANLIKLPQGKTQASIKEVQIDSSSLQKLFTNHRVEWIFRVYPNFTGKDTVIISAEGLEVRIGDLTKVFVLKFNEEEKADQFLQQVKTPHTNLTSEI